MALDGINSRTGRPISGSSAAGYGERVADLRPPCTDLGKNVPWSPLYGRCPCGSLVEMMGRVGSSQIAQVIRRIAGEPEFPYICKLTLLQ